MIKNFFYFKKKQLKETMEDIEIKRENFFIKSGYVSRTKVNYFNDVLDNEIGIIHQPDVYPFAGYLGEKFGYSYIIDIGCGSADKLTALYPKFKIIGVDYGNNINYCQRNYHFGKWIRLNLEDPIIIPINPKILKNSIIVCADVIEHLVNPLFLLKNLKYLLDYAPLAILTTPERDLVRGFNNIGPPANLSHSREWNLKEIESLLKSYDFNIIFTGLTVNNNYDFQKKNTIIILGNNHSPKIKQASDNFSIIAIMTSYNEEDIIVPSIMYLINQGIEIYLIDNWSIDKTYDLAKQFLNKGLIGLERFPVDGPSKYYDWYSLLSRVEEITKTLKGDWFIHHDVDEIRESPWQNVSLKDAIFYVDMCGFNSIDHTVIEFYPVDNNFPMCGDFEKYFKFFEFGKRPGHFLQIKTWKNLGKKISLADSGGHEVVFEGRFVYPFKFLLKHYPIRSQYHGEKKIFKERKPRYNPNERVKGWHTHYDYIKDGYSFIKESKELKYFDDLKFYKEYLVERISGIGILRNNIEIENKNEKTL